jgi:nucleotide-binding universal stress UspA family protein
MTRVLVPLDGSSFAEAALEPALELCRRQGAELHVVQVHEFRLPAVHAEAWLTVDPEVQRQLREDEEQYLRDAAARCAERAGVRVHHELLEGQVVDALARYVESAGIDRIVMTTHGRSGLSRVWLGSVADSLVRYAPVPILLLRPDAANGRAPVLAEYTRRVLVPLDGTELSERALGPAMSLARDFGASLALFHASAPPATMGRAVMSPAMIAASRHEAEQARVYLEDLAERLRGEGLGVEVVTRTHAVPAAAILEEAQLGRGTIIAMATHGRSGWARVALGSVADKVLRGAECPVLLYRPPAGGVDVAAAFAERGAQAGGES